MTALAALTAAMLLGAAPKADDALAAAKLAAKEARLAFDAGDFTTALAKYEEAFRLKPIPALQFNLGQCHKNLGHTERALYFFRRFLESSPPEVQAAEVRPLIEELEVKADEEAKAKAEADAHARTLELEQAKQTSAKAQAEMAAAQAAAAEKAAEEARRKAELETALKTEIATEPAYKKPWFWGVVIGAVVVAAGVGIGAGVATAPKPTPTTWPDINAR